MQKNLTSLFLVLFVWFLPFFINPELMTIKDNDLGRTYIPLFSFIRNSVLNYHRIPLWRPDQFMGETFIGNPISSLFYPANLLFIIFSPHLGAIIYLFVHFLIAAFSTFYLAKSFSLSQKASFVAALFYSLSTKMLVHLEAGHITMIAAFSLFPLVFLSIRKLSIKYQPKWLAAASVTLALIYFAYPTIFYYVFIFSSTYWIYKIFIDSKIKPKQILKSAFILGEKTTALMPSMKRILSEDQRTTAFRPWESIFLSITVLSISIMSIELLPHLEFAPLSTRPQLKLEDVALPLWNFKRFIISVLFPYLEKNLDHEAFLYLGLVPTVLSVIGFLFLPRIKKTIVFCGSLFMLLYVSGLSTPLFPVLYKYLPLLNYSRITTRPWFIMALLVSLLSAIAIEKIKNKKVIYFVMILFLIENLFIFNVRFSKIPKLSFSNEAMYQFIQSDKDLFRVYCTTYCFNPQQLARYSIQTLNGEGPIQQTSVINFMQKAGNYSFDKFAVIFPPYQVWQTGNLPIPDASLLGTANVKYVASTYELNSKNFLFIEKFENIFLYKNNQFMPRFYFERENSTDQVNLAHYSPNEINLKFARQKSAKTIVISENYYPGWVASVVNQKFNVQKKDEIIRKIVIPSDTEDVWLKYQPKSFILGRTITLGTLTFLTLYIFRKRNNQYEKNRNS